MAGLVGRKRLCGWLHERRQFVTEPAEDRFE